MILAFPIFIPLAFIIFAFLFRHSRSHPYIAMAFAGFNLLVSLLILIQVQSQDMIKMQMGNWPAPFGITLVADRFSALLLVVAALVFLACMAYSIPAVDTRHKKLGFYLFSFGIIMGVNGSFIAGDIFNLYVWFEVMLMSSFILMSHGGERNQLEGSIKYLILNLISSFFLVAGIGLLYGNLGTLNMADIASRLMEYKSLPTATNPAFILIFVGFAI